jgi:large subunit ribosomal protein L3
MGGKRKTVLGLRIIRIDKDNNLLYIRGAVPGARNSIVTVRMQES